MWGVEPTDALGRFVDHFSRHNIDVDAMSAASIQTRVKSVPRPVKHRACDDCRSRKIACTKEPDGCSRCKRDRILCHYSPQKQMGRPKKRADVEDAGGQQPMTLPASSQRFTIANAASDEEPAIFRSNDAMDVDFSSYIDPCSSGAADSADLADSTFLNTLGPDPASVLLFHDQSSQPDEDAPNRERGRDFWNFEVNFDLHSPSAAAANSNDTSLQLSPSLNFSTHSLSFQGTSTSELQSHAPSLPRSCNCLSKLHLALKSLGRLPTEVGRAMRLARSASMAAHDAVQCRVCFPPLTVDMKVHVSNSENMMILGALFPLIVEAYQRILDMVESEVKRAICERRQLRFTLIEYGGFWGQLGMEKNTRGVETHYSDAILEPAMWRLAVRALLRTDVYGINSFSSPGSTMPCVVQLGLKDIISEMDEMSRKQHTDIDAPIDAGMAYTNGPSGLCAHHNKSEEPPCRTIIKVARDAVDSLYIP